MIKRLGYYTLALALGLSAQLAKGQNGAIPELHAKAFDTVLNGKKVSLYQLKAKNITAYITNYGARLVSMQVPGKNGKMVDVIAGFADIKSYLQPTDAYFGSVVGRYGNRIAKGKFSIDGQPYQITVNNNGNALHGGKNGFHKQVWDASQPNAHTLVLKYLSKDGEEGFPGNLNVKITYSVTDNQELKAEYEATTDKKTIVNLTNHSYFNLNGEGSGKILNHKVQLFADRYTPIDSVSIPTGELPPVAGTPFDFTTPQTIGSRIKQANEQLKNGKGYDHNFVLSGQKVNGLNHAVKVIGDVSGIQMDIYTQEPGIQFYSGNFMRSKNTFKSGAKDEYRTAIALEPQHYPDSPNQPSFPSTQLAPGSTYHTATVYKFSVAK